jgi:glycosyltransferase involved in cell wall biosynthesis
MTVLHVIKTSVGASWAYRQVGVLLELGAHVFVLLPDERGFEERARSYERAGAKVIKADVDVPIRSPWLIPGRLHLIRDIVARVQPDVIHSHFVGPTYLFRLALGRNHPTPRIFQVPGPLHLERGPFGRIDVGLAGDADYWIGSCALTCRLYRALGVPADRVFKSFYGAVIEDFPFHNRTGRLRRELGVDADTTLVGMVAYMYPPKRHLGQWVGLKGHEDFIDAMAIVTRAAPHIRAVVIGGPWGGADWYARALRRRADHGCGGAVAFTGFRSDVGEIYGDLDVVVHPSLSENLGGASESLLAGVPTIASNVGGLPDIVIDGETGWLVPPRDPRRLADCILQVANQPEEARRRADRGRTLTAHALDIRRTAREVYGIYRCILDGRAAPAAESGA